MFGNRMMEKIFRFICLKALAMLLSKIVYSDCQCLFPKEWSGDWYDTRLGTISSISRKGDCVDSRDNYYLMEDREIGCYMCLLVEHRHANILQYKESYCSGKASLHVICSTIQQETMQHTLIRGTSAATPCPFQGAYHFNYNNNSGGTCRYPMSYAKPCAGGSRFSLHFNQCPDAAYSYDRVVVLECLATWREGASKFLIGRWIYSEANAEHDEYRCFMYRLLGSVVYMSMSADGTCRGLRSSIDGPVLLELTQDTLGWPKPRCSFPAWMTRTSWDDLSARRLFRVNENGDVIESYARKTMTSPHELYKTYRCFSVLTPNISDEFISVQLTSDGCLSGYQCLRLKKKTENLLEIHEAERTVPGRCPYDAAQFFIHTGTSLCPSYLRSGCNASHVIDIVSSCSKKPGMMLACLVTWREDKKRLFVARQIGDDSGIANCYSFTRIGDNLYFTTDSTCNLDTPYLLRDKVSYSLNQEMLPCRTLSDQQSESARSQDPMSSVSSTATYRMNAPEAYKDAAFSDIPVESIAGEPSHLWPEMDEEEEKEEGQRRSGVNWDSTSLFLWVLILLSVAGLSL